MFVFTEDSIRPQVTPWGLEVEQRLSERMMSQDELVVELIKRGCYTDKSTVCGLKTGKGYKTKRSVIVSINEILGIVGEN